MNEITMKMQADQLIRMALQEDITSEDVSTNAVMRSAVKGTVDLIAKEDGIIAGLDVYARVFQILDEKTEIDFNFKDGNAVKKGDLLGTVNGDIRVLLSGERVALNYLQRMSGIATYTSQVAKLLEGSKVTLLDTRKTTPKCRVFEKYDVDDLEILVFDSTILDTFTGKRIELPQYQQEYSKSEFEVITETYNWGRAVFQGWLWTEGNPVHCIMNIYFTGNMVYVIDEA